MNKYKIYSYMRPEDATEPSKHPGTIVYPKALDRTLYSKHYSVDGERVKTIYFANFLDGKYSEPIIREVYSYNRNEQGYLDSWDLTISWMLNSGEWSDDVKQVTKFFSNTQKKKAELIKRRGNIIIEVEAAAEDFGLSEAIQLLFNNYFVSISKYREAGSKDFFNDLQKDTKLEFLNYPTSLPGVDVRMWLLDRFSIGVV